MTDQSINQSIKTHFYSAICRERIRGALDPITFEYSLQTITLDLGKRY